MSNYNKVLHSTFKGFYFSTFIHPSFSSSEMWKRRNWTWTLNQSAGRAVFRYLAFHMTFIDSEFLCSSSSWQYKEWADGALPRLEATLSLSSVLNNVTNVKPWRTFRGITQKQSLKQWDKVLCLQMHFGNRYFKFWKCLFPMQTRLNLKFCQKKGGCFWNR